MKKNKSFFGSIFIQMFFCFIIFSIAGAAPVYLALNNKEFTIIAGSFVIAGFFISLIFLIGILKPIKRIEKYLQTVAKNDFGISCKLRSPAFSNVEKLLNTTMLSNLNESIENIKASVVTAQDSSNIFLTEVQKAITNASRISLGADYIGSRVENLETLLEDSVKENAVVQENILEYGRFMDNQVTSINETGILIEQITSKLNEFLNGLEEKKERAQNLGSLTRNSEKTVKETISAVTEIAENIGVIKNTITIVASVASQTNLLAMNASIEAAHAGEAGQGFAVVANEIRSLAEKTSEQVQTVTGHLVGMNDLIIKAVERTSETGFVFEKIHDDVNEVVGIFDSVLSYYGEIGDKNRNIHERFIKIRETENEISQRMKTIETKVNSNNENLEGIYDSTEKIRSILKRNVEEALRLSHVQAPIYTNAVYNAKKLEEIRKFIDIFHLADTPYEMWKADKRELHALLEAIFDHFDWTVLLLDFLHGRSQEILPLIKEKTTPFAKWLYGPQGKAHSGTEIYSKIISHDKVIHSKAKLIETLTLAGKEQEATIEFSELLEYSREMVVLLNELKIEIIKKSINAQSKIYIDSYTEVDPQYASSLETSHPPFELNDTADTEINIFTGDDEKWDTSNEQAQPEQSEEIFDLEEAEEVSELEEAEEIEELEESEYLENVIDNTELEETEKVILIEDAEDEGIEKVTVLDKTETEDLSLLNNNSSIKLEKGTVTVDENGENVFIDTDDDVEILS